MKRLAELRLMSKLEENSALATARAKGTEEGLRQGKEEGLKQAKIEIARKLIQINLTNKQIIDSTGLSNEEIEKIRNL